jgi:hypothetical protein
MLAHILKEIEKNVNLKFITHRFAPSLFIVNNKK